MLDRQLLIEVKKGSKPKGGSPNKKPKGRFISVAKRRFNGDTYHLGPTNDSKEKVKKEADKLKAKGWKARVVEIPKSMRTWEKEHGFNAPKYAVYWRKPTKK